MCKKSKETKYTGVGINFKIDEEIDVRSMDE